MFGNWIGGFGNDHKGLALLGAATVCWSIWLGTNELIFENKISISFAGYFYCSPEASRMGCATEAGLMQFFGNGYATFDSSGQGVFFPGAWLAV
jgi:hypothetical protein